MGHTIIETRELIKELRGDHTIILSTHILPEVEQICEKVQTYVDLGCTGFIPWCSDYPDTETMDLFASEVMPHFH